jgi:hypothetical protein
MDDWLNTSHYWLYGEDDVLQTLDVPQLWDLQQTMLLSKLLIQSLKRWFLCLYVEVVLIAAAATAATATATATSHTATATWHSRNMTVVVMMTMTMSAHILCSHYCTCRN